MIIVVDTNVLVSATYWKGESLKVLRLADEGRIKLVISQELIEEYNKVINSDEASEKIEKRRLVAEKAIIKTVNEAILVQPQEKIKLVSEDPDDDKVIECAAGKADFIITQDKHLLKMKSYKKIMIVTPQEFLREL